MHHDAMKGSLRTSYTTQVSDTGYMPTFMFGVRLAMTTASRFGTGAYAFELLDAVTGMSVFCRGYATVQAEETSGGLVVTMRTGEAEGDGKVFQVIFGRSRFVGGSLRSLGPLHHGEVVLNTLPPKSLPRRVRRFRGAGAVEIGHGVLMLKPASPSAWPPPECERKLRPRAGEGLWHKSNPDRPRYC
jgi:hypothetical protein